jgi:NAD+ kinase
MIRAGIVEKEKLDEKTLVVAVGGDGTMLYAMKMSSGTGASVLGINLGKLGFLAEFDRIDIVDVIEKALNGRYNPEKRTMLIASGNLTNPYAHENSSFDYIASNDIAITHERSNRIIDFDIWIGGRHAGNHIGNGCIISTPTGSTAYGLSNGGAIIEPSLDILQITFLSPLTMSSRPIIVPGDYPIKIIINSKSKCIASFDGREMTMDNDAIGDLSINIKRHQHSIVLHDVSWNFFVTLAAKLHWNKK